MPSLRPLTEVARYDAKFFADVVVPAIAAAGFAGAVALAPDEGDIVIAASDADLDALFAGRQKTELSALDKLRQQRSASTSSLAIRGSSAALAALVQALAAKKAAAHSAPSRTRDIGAEALATARAGGRSADRMKRGGRYIKGIRPGGRSAAAPFSTATTTTTSTAAAAAASLLDAGRPAALPADRVAFALRNLCAFIEVGLARAESEATRGDDDAWMALVITPGEVRRE